MDNTICMQSLHDQILIVRTFRYVLSNCFLTAEEAVTSKDSSKDGSKDSFIDKDDICAKIEGLGGMVIDQYDADIVSSCSYSYTVYNCLYKIELKLNQVVIMD